MGKIKENLKDVFRNYGVGLIFGLLIFAAITFHVSDFDETNIHWYYIGISICSGGGVACIIYGIKKFFYDK